MEILGSILKRPGFTFLLIILPVITPNIGVAQEQVNLENCQSWARENYPLISQYELLDLSEDFSLSNANKAYLPQLDITLIGGVIEGFPSFNPQSEGSSSLEGKLISVVQLRQVIWDGGRTKNVKKLTEVDHDISRAELEVRFHDLENRVNEIYFGILLIQERIKQMELLIENLNKNKERVVAGKESGVAYQSDLDEIEVEILEAGQQLRELSYSRSAYVQMLSLLVGKEIPGSTTLDRPPGRVDPVSVGLSRPELTVFSRQRTKLEISDKMNKTGLNPTIGLLGFGTFITPGVDFGLSQFDHILVAGLSVSWSIGGLYKRGNDRQLNVIHLQSLELEEESFRFTTDIALEEKEMELVKYQKLIEEDEKIIEIKTRLINSYRNKYENGIATMRDLLIQINNENLAKQSKILHEVQYLKTQYQIMHLKGT